MIKVDSTTNKIIIIIRRGGGRGGETYSQVPYCLWTCSWINFNFFAITQDPLLYHLLCYFKSRIPGVVHLSKDIASALCLPASIRSLFLLDHEIGTSLPQGLWGWNCPSSLAFLWESSFDGSWLRQSSAFLVPLYEINFSLLHVRQCGELPAV